ncbi:DUF6932 family protein [Bacillus sp. Marseille-P3661]|uniref:DUF6932 family protein n=1 Tax=Bacillus sp. Marseille-P3661 TaxID=1936234 RepID=UPI000C85E39B|nr:hypothetical protein [Bacillus sp. Marseille-P3661]
MQFKYGVLDKDYTLTIDGLRNSLLVNGPTTGEYIPWDKERRLYLVNQLEIVANQVWNAGFDKIFVDGSFVEDKASPEDIDCYFECGFKDFSQGKVEEALRKANPEENWGLGKDDLITKNGKTRFAIWHKYHVDLWPECGLESGIFDKSGSNNLKISQAFRQQKETYRKKGIVKLVK